MLSGVCVGTNDLETAGRFYDAVFATIGLKRIVTVENEIGYGLDSGDMCFWVLKPFDGQAATFGNGTQVMFSAQAKEDIAAFHATALQQGGSDEGAPGPRGLF